MVPEPWCKKLKEGGSGWRSAASSFETLGSLRESVRRTVKDAAAALRGDRKVEHVIDGDAGGLRLVGRDVARDTGGTIVVKGELGSARDVYRGDSEPDLAVVTE